MSLRFHETLDVLVAAAARYQVPLDRQTVIVRDGAGRLILARERIDNSKELEGELRRALGGYAGSVVLVRGPAVTKLLQDPSVVEAEVLVDGDAQIVSYADRRIVGVDWVRQPSTLRRSPYRLVFGSLKGGVGRSTALAVVAAEAARRGLRVLTVDLDLEAPGIGSMLLPRGSDWSTDRMPRYGAVDYLLENNLDGIDDEELIDFVGISPFQDGFISVIPAAGRETEDRPQSMIAKLSRALIEDRQDGRVLSLSDQIDAMIVRFCDQQDYDLVLIDARAGMAEISAAPLLGLGAHVLLFGTDQPQTYTGYSYILAHLSSMSDFSQLTEEKDWRRRVSFVQSKAPSAADKRAIFRERIYELCVRYLYEGERLSPDGTVSIESFNFSPSSEGADVPHDALHISYAPDYDVFDPGKDRTQLDREVYSGPFSAFLRSVFEVIDHEGDVR
jgi:Mrp family chromosome partitioning ATPase